MTRYCVVCGRRVNDEEYIRELSYCIDCYLKNRGLFKEKPVLEITICPKCGSWLFGSEWQKPLSLEEVIRRVLLSVNDKYVDTRFITILDAEVVERPIKVYKNRYSVRVKLLVVFNNNIHREVIENIEFVLNKRVCPRDIARAGKIHKALIQVRSERGGLSDSEKKTIMDILSEPGVAEEVVEIKENKYGLDIKVYSVNIAKKIAHEVVKITGAKIIESFKPTRYDPRKGRWKGITTISIRLPSISVGDLVLYKGEPAIIKNIGHNGILLKDLSTGNMYRIDYESYWKGILKKPGNLYYYKAYRVIARDSTTLYLLDEKTGEIKEFPYKGIDIKEGAIVYIVKYNDKEYIAVKPGVESA
ncbi:MAG: 60S ribosomal export protein NMD3 [Thermoprotei archaeon]